MQKFIKKNWQVICIIILLFFSMQKCTQSCNRAGDIERNESRIEQQDSTIQAYEAEIGLLRRDTADYLNQIRMYQKFDTRRNYSDSINAANLAKQRAQTEELVRQNRNLIKKIDNGKESNK